MPDMYGELCARFYDLDKPTAPELALDWFAERLAGKCLEPMCGSGRFLVPLLRRGLEIDGADNSPAMLDACRRGLAAAGLTANLWQQDLSSLQLHGRYDVAFIPASSFCLLGEPGRALASLRAVARRVLIEFELPQPGDDWPKDSSRTVTAGGVQIRLASRVEYDAATQTEIHTNRYELKRSGRVVQTEDETLRLRCYTPEQMTEALKHAGFGDVTIEHPEFGWVASAR